MGDELEVLFIARSMPQHLFDVDESGRVFYHAYVDFTCLCCGAYYVDEDSIPVIDSCPT